MAYIVEFNSVPSDLKVAAIAFRNAVGDIKSLNDSLLGRHPLPAADLDMDEWAHVELRKFTDEEGLQAFESYLDALIGLCASKGREDLPTFDRKADGFFYRTHSAYAEIGLNRGTDGRWFVQGRAKFASNPAIVVKKLRHVGIQVRVTRR